MNFGIKTKNPATDSRLRSPQKIDFRADGTQESHPTAWELIIIMLEQNTFIFILFFLFIIFLFFFLLFRLILSLSELNPWFENLSYFIYVSFVNYAT